MTGVKGRSGTRSTPEQKARASAAAKVASDARWSAGSAQPGQPGIAAMLDPESDDPDKRLGKPMSWGDELKRQQVEGEKIANRKREVEVQRAEVELARAQDERDEARGKLLTRDDHRASVQTVVEKILANLSIITGAAIATHPPEAQPSVRHLMTQAETEFRLAAMKALAGK